MACGKLLSGLNSNHRLETTVYKPSVLDFSVNHTPPCSSEELLFSRKIGATEESPKRFGHRCSFASYYYEVLYLPLA